MSNHLPPYEVHEDNVGDNPDITINKRGYGIIAEVGGGALQARREAAHVLVDSANAIADVLAVAPKIIETYEWMIGNYPEDGDLQKELNEFRCAVMKAQGIPDICRGDE